MGDLTQGFEERAEQMSVRLIVDRRESSQADSPSVSVLPAQSSGDPLFYGCESGRAASRRVGVPEHQPCPLGRTPECSRVPDVTLDLRALRTRHLDGARPLPREIERALREDGRLEAARLLRQLNARRRANRAEGQRLRRMLRFEERWWAQGIERVAGIDEAGMSPLAGPVVAAAVILPVGLKLREVDDSKKLDPRTRARLAPVIREAAIAWAVGIVDVAEIDRLNIYHAGLLAMQRAFEGLRIEPQALLIDARRLRGVALPQEPIIGGDGKSLSIAAASILAKTTRDAIMCELDQRYPGYGFAQHKGYGVREHRSALQQLGCCPEHRRSFGPVKAILATQR